MMRATCSEDDSTRARGSGLPRRDLLSYVRRIVSNAVDVAQKNQYLYLVE